MKPRNSWPLAATFVLSLCMAATVLGQNQPGENQQAQNQSQSSDGNSSSKEQGRPGENASQDLAQSSKTDSNAKPGSQNANDAQAQSQQWSNQSKSGSSDKNKNPGNWRVWAQSGPGGEVLSWRSYAPMPPLSLAPVDDSLRVNLGLPEGQGLVVTAVDPDSSAARAGIQVNDILLKLGETNLFHVENFYNRLKEIGEKPVSLTLLRDGKVQTIPVQPKIDVTLHPVLAPTLPTREFWIGVSVTAIEPALRAQLRLPPHGLIVSGVGDDSPAAKAGVKRHDILLEVDGVPLTEPAKLAKYVQAKGAKPIVLQLVRKGTDRMQVTVTPERRKPTPDSSATQSQRDPAHYTFIQPGGVVTYPTNNIPMLTLPNQTAGNVLTLPSQPYDQLWTGAYQWQVAPSAQPVVPLDPSFAMAKRLDALDAELKELRKSVMAYKQNAKVLEELNKRLEESLAAMKKKN